MDKALWNFLLPHWDGSAYGGLQCLLALLALAPVIALPLLLARTAQPAQWQARLIRIADQPASLPLTTTPEQLSQAVATAAERWAVVLPGLMLMLGLLGTFIGLGLALSAVGVPDAQAALGSVIDALGSQFKSAVWGLLAFLILKSWNTVRPHEQARLAWSLATLQALTDAAVQRQSQQQAQQQQRLVEAITQSGNALLVAQQAEAQRAHLRHGELLDALQQTAARAS
ncbi:hypothetical protein [Herbaspirillum rubrisubalbicans]|uniref:MotA/TolQ/ExbB proton channel family protein n=1 Tax=Herbaspirillum rubrisubalbicans TaxID=80842 RepID=A0AAD0UCM3_9BURK|nr:hypothetical protein [Herbaspirillum rubrisubalbicans]AYR26326.1 hypothetical protein RC54_22030 [Herbaspirillum rubrisubalbicans]